MSKWKCKTPNCGKPCYAELPEHHKPKNCILDERIPDWKEDNETTISSIKLPKLTAEVFDREDCPEWAKYAAVDKCGSVRLFSHSPWLGESCWNWANGEVTQLFGVTFDASDWQKSRIKRPEKKTLPEWCKVGKWVYDPSGNLYGKVGKMDASLLGADSHIVMHYVAEGGSATLPYAMVLNNLKPARLRPYNAEEMRGLVGKALDGKIFRSIIVGYDACTNRVNTVCCEYNSDALFVGFTIDGKPCGVLEHLNDNGEWVE